MAEKEEYSTAQAILLQAGFNRERIQLGEAPSEIEAVVLSQAHKYGITSLIYISPPDVQFLEDSFKGSNDLDTFQDVTFDLSIPNVERLMALFSNVTTLSLKLDNEEPQFVGSMLRDVAQGLADPNVMKRLQHLTLYTRDLTSSLEATNVFWQALSDRRSIQHLTWIADAYPAWGTVNMGTMMDWYLPKTFPYVTHLNCNLPYLKELDARFPAMTHYTADLTLTTEMAESNPDGIGAHYAVVNEGLLYLLEKRQKTLESIDLTVLDDVSLAEAKPYQQVFQFEKLHTWKARTLHHRLLEYIMVHSVVGAKNRTVGTFHWQSGDNPFGIEWELSAVEDSLRAVVKALEEDRTVFDLQLISKVGYGDPDPDKNNMQFPPSSAWQMPISRLSLSPWLLPQKDTALSSLTGLTHLEIVGPRSKEFSLSTYLPPLLTAHPAMEELRFYTFNNMRLQDVKTVATALETLPPTLRVFSWRVNAQRAVFMSSHGTKMKMQTEALNKAQSTLLFGLAKNRGLVAFNCQMFDRTPFKDEPADLTQQRLKRALTSFLKENQTLVSLNMRLLLNLSPFTEILQKYNTSLEYLHGSSELHTRGGVTPRAMQEICIERRMQREQRLRMWASAAAVTRAMLTSGPEGAALRRSFSPLMKNISELADLPGTAASMEYGKKAAENLLYRLHSDAPPAARAAIERDEVVAQTLSSSSSSSSSARTRTRKRKNR